MSDQDENRAEAGAEQAGAAEEQAGAPEETAAAADTEEAAEAGHREAGGDGWDQGLPGEDRPLTDAERAELYRKQLKELSVIDVARDVMLTLVTVGYQKMGLTDETADLRDLEDARLSIELLRGIVGALEGAAEADELETYRSTLAQMQLNYARVAS